jgi:hypothetical protein
VTRARAVFLTVAVVAATAMAVGTAVAADLVAPKTVAFKGSYTGTVTEKVDGQTVNALANGSGSGTLVGKTKLAGAVTGTTASPPCSPLSGPGTIFGPVGKLRLMLVPTTSRACVASQDDQNAVTFSGNAKVTGGTLKFRKARGSLHFTGNYDRSAGTFDVKLTGRITY